MQEDDFLDPGTGFLLKPGPMGKDCPGNGTHPGLECCCDECDHFLVCFPQWRIDPPLR